MIEPSLIVRERGCILERMRDYFVHKAGTMALFVRGSVAEGTADPWSDIDFAVVVEDSAFARFCAERHSAPQQWGDLLFNSGSMGRNMCVSHFAPFIKVDVFYYRAGDLSPSPWHARGIQVLYDPQGVVRDLCERSRGMSFRAEPEAVNRNINQALASAHEVLRRVERGELAYAQSILDSLRHNVALADDFLHDRPAMGLSHVETRCSDPHLLAALDAAHPRSHAPAAILAAAQSLVPILREQIAAMTAKFSLDRCSERDGAILAIISEWQLHGTEEHR